jgi:hypothetical protein
MFTRKGICYAGTRKNPKPYIAIKQATPLEGYKVHTIFTNNEERIYDFKDVVKKGVFQQLQDKKLFDTVYVDDFGALNWLDGQLDFDPCTILRNGVAMSNE